jgi:hypothetical protein
MPYCSSVERLAKEKGYRKGYVEGVRQGFREGRRKGLLMGIEISLRVRFGQAGLELLPKIGALETRAQLWEIAIPLMTGDSLDALRKRLSELAGEIPSADHICWATGPRTSESPSVQSGHRN